MHTTSSASRRVLGGLGVVAASLLLLAPVAGAEAPAAADGAGRSETAPHGSAPESRPEQPEQSATGVEASTAQGDNRSEAVGDHGTAGPMERDAVPTPGNGNAGPTSPGNSGEHKVTICHRTNSATNPYVQITVDFHAVDGHGEGSDHAGVHTGDVYEPGMKERGETWGDIIPAFTTPDGDAHPAVNWTTAGQAIFENGCELPDTAPAVDEQELDQEVLGDADEDDLGTVAPVTGPTDDAVAGPADEVLSEELADVGAALGEAVAVLGHQVVRDVAAAPGQVVAASTARPATIASLASTGTGIAVLTMFGLGLLTTGYLLVSSLRDRVGRSA